MKRGTNPKSLANIIPPKKGEVRNPDGVNGKRPFTDRMYAKGEQPLIETKAGRKRMKELDLPETATWADAMIEATAINGANGNLQAVNTFADRIEGKPPQRTEITGNTRVIHEFRVREVKRNQKKSSE